MVEKDTSKHLATMLHAQFYRYLHLLCFSLLIAGGTATPASAQTASTAKQSEIYATDNEIMKITLRGVEFSFPKTQDGRPVLWAYVLQGKGPSRKNQTDRSFPMNYDEPITKKEHAEITAYFAELDSLLANGASFIGATIVLDTRGLVPQSLNTFPPARVGLRFSALFPPGSDDSELVNLMAKRNKWLNEVVLRRSPDEFGFATFSYSESKNWGMDYSVYTYGLTNYVATAARDRTPSGDPIRLNDKCDVSSPYNSPLCDLRVFWRDGVVLEVSFYSRSYKKAEWLPYFRRAFDAVRYLEQKKQSKH